MNTYLPFISCILSLIFALLVLKRYAVRRRIYLLSCGIRMVFYSVGEFCEGFYGFFWMEPVDFSSLLSVRRDPDVYRIPSPDYPNGGSRCDRIAATVEGHMSYFARDRALPYFVRNKASSYC